MAVRILTLVYFVSGACSLMDEVVWTRLLKLSIGNTVYASSIVVSVFMGGLALGRVGYDKWWKFTWPLLVILLLLYAIVLSVGVFFPGQIF